MKVKRIKTTKYLTRQFVVEMLRDMANEVESDDEPDEAIIKALYIWIKPKHKLMDVHYKE